MNRKFLISGIAIIIFAMLIALVYSFRYSILRFIMLTRYVLYTEEYSLSDTALPDYKKINFKDKIYECWNFEGNLKGKYIGLELLDSGNIQTEDSINGYIGHGRKGVSTSRLTHPTLLDTIPEDWTAITVGMWVKFHEFDTIGMYGAFFSKFQQPWWHYYFEMYDDDITDDEARPAVWYRFGDFNGKGLFSIKTLKKEKWYYVLSQLSKHKGLEIWIDGQRTAYDPREKHLMPDGNRTDFKLGFTTSGKNIGWNMTIDEACIFKHTLTDDEIRNLSNASKLESTSR